jgi:GNAT superfamily N-acetyltransferase
MTIQIVRLFEADPDVLALMAEAEAEFGAPPIACSAVGADDITVLAAIADGDHAGVGALSIDHGVGRILNVYVRPAIRRSGVGRALGGALVQEGLHAVERIELTADSEDAAQFWQAIGFRRLDACRFETTRCG